MRATQLPFLLRDGWKQSWPEDGLHPPPSCLHGHMCSFTDSPSNIPIIKALPQAGNFLLPARLQLLFESDGGSCTPWLTPPASVLFPSPHGATREWPVATEARLKTPRTPPPFRLLYAKQLTKGTRRHHSVVWQEGVIFGVRANISVHLNIFTNGAF